MPLSKFELSPAFQSPRVGIPGLGTPSCWYRYRVFDALRIPSTNHSGHPYIALHTSRLDDRKPAKLSKPTNRVTSKMGMTSTHSQFSTSQSQSVLFELILLAFGLAKTYTNLQIRFESGKVAAAAPRAHQHSIPIIRWARRRYKSELSWVELGPSSSSSRVRSTLDRQHNTQPRRFRKRTSSESRSSLAHDAQELTRTSSSP